VTVLNEKGIPSPLVHTMMCAPQSRMDVITPAEQDQIVAASSIAKSYNEEIDRESAYEMLNQKISGDGNSPGKSTSQTETHSTEKSGGIGETISTIANSSLTRTVLKEVTRGIFGVLLGGSSRRRSKSIF